MKKFIYIIIVIVAMTSFYSCREKTTGEKVQDAVESAADDAGDAIDDVIDN